MRYALLSFAKLSLATRSTRLTPRTLSIITIKDLYKRIEKSAEKIALGTLKCTQHSLGSQNKSTASLSVSLSVNQNAALTSKLPEKFAYSAGKWTHRSPVNQLASIQDSFQASKATAKTRFMTMAHAIPQASTA